MITTTTAPTAFTELFIDGYSPCSLQIVYKDELCGFGTEYKGNYESYGAVPGQNRAAGPPNSVVE